MRFLFDDFELDAGRLQLLRAGRPLQVEPRVLELLVYLVEHRDRLVGKEELNERLWGGRVVTDAALARCLYQARRALGDSSSEQRYLRTVHGRGVRLNEEVEVVEETGGEGDAAGAAVAARPAAAAARERPRSRRVAFALVVGAAVTVSAAVLVLAGRGANGALAPAPPPAAAAAPVAPAGPTLALLPLGVDTSVGGERREEVELLALSLTDLLHTRLAGVPGLQLRPLVATRDEAATAGSLREIAERVAASHLVTSSLRLADQDRAVVELTLYEMRPRLPARETPLGTFVLPRLRASDDFAELVRVRDAIAQRTVRLLGSSFVFGDEEPGGTRNGESWRLYVLAYQKLSDDFCTGTRPAIALLERALELDPEFGLAWEALGTAHYNRVWACGEPATLYDDAFAALDRAIELAPALRSPRFTSITLLIESGRVEEAYELLLEELATHPDDPLSLNAKSYALRYAGFLDESAAALDRVLVLDPLAFAVGTIGGSPNAYLYQGRLDRFLAVVPISEMPYHLWYRGFADVLRGRPERARESLEPAFRSSPGQIFGRLAHALLAVIDGDDGAARAIVRQVSEQRDAMGAVDGEITLKQAQILALAGAREAALEELEKTVAQGFFCSRCLALDPSLAGLRDDPRWEPIVSAARRRHLAFGERFGLPPDPR